MGSPRAKFAQPELGLGILAGAGANWRLPQAVGLPLARRMLYAGEVLDADAALTAGLVDAVHPPAELLDRAITLAESVAARSWRALELTKLALRAHRPATTSLDIVSQAVLFDGEDKRERMNRFLDDRAARRAARAAADGSAAAAAPKPAPAQGPTGADPVPPFRVRQLTIEDGLALATWSSPGAWHIEDALEAPEPDEGYWAVVDSATTCSGSAAWGRPPGCPDNRRTNGCWTWPSGSAPSWPAGVGVVSWVARPSPTPARSPWTGGGTTVPDWNTVGQHAARQAGFTRWRSASTTSSVTTSSSNLPESATPPFAHPTPPIRPRPDPPTPPTREGVPPMTMAVTSYVAGRWQDPAGDRAALLDATTSRPVAEIGTAPIDMVPVIDHARSVGGPALREMTFHERALALNSWPRI